MIDMTIYKHLNVRPLRVHCGGGHSVDVMASFVSTPIS